MEHQQQRPQSWRDRVLEWEMGLPSAEDLTPLSQTLIPPDLALAFNISTDPFREARRASNHTISSLRSIADAEENQEDEDQELDRDDDADGAANSGGAKKRARVVWTPQLHRRFVEVVGHLGIKNAVPKTIVQMMNVEGLTRENVASHLQKFRLYVRRMQADGSHGGGPSSSSDALFSSTHMLPLPHQQQSMQPAMVPVFGSMYPENWGFHGQEFQSSGGGNMFG